MLGITYKSAWFMAMRIREAMKLDAKAGPLGGEGKVIESDETFVGGKKKNVHKGKPAPKKHAVHALVERGGEVRASHVADVTAKTLRATPGDAGQPQVANCTPTIALTNLSVGKEFAEHKTVNHSQDEYFVRMALACSPQRASSPCSSAACSARSTRSASSTCSATCDEFAFRWNNRIALGVEDAERAGRCS